jgi:transposase-like protein
MARPAIEITDSLIERTAYLAAQGLPNKSIAEGLGIGEDLFYRWLRQAKDGTGTDAHVRFSEAIQSGAIEAEEKLVAKLAQGDERSASWLLTHSPRWRNTWSDAAATRREVQRTMTEVVAAIESAPGLTDDQRRAVLLSISARGINAPTE